MRREEGVNSMNKLWYVKMIVRFRTSSVLLYFKCSCVSEETHAIIFQNLKDTAQQLRGLAAIPEDQCSTSSTHTPAHNYLSLL